MTPLQPPDVAGTVTIRGELIVYASEGVAALAGRSVEEMVGHPFVEFIVEEERALVSERAARRRRGEAVPQRYEITLALPAGERRPVELFIDVAGEDVLVHVRDSALRVARRLRLEAVATLGAALQRERTEEAICARLRDGLAALDLSCALMRAEPEGVRILWASVPLALEKQFRALTGSAVDGYLGRWNEFSRRVYAEGSTFTEDWGLAASQFMPEEAAAETRTILTQAGLSTAAGVRLGEKDVADQYLVVAGAWLGGEDAPALRLLAAQLAAALGAARAIADLSRRNADLAALNRVAELAGEASDLPGLLARTSEVLRATVGCAGVALFVLDEATDDLVSAYADGASPEATARFQRFPRSSPLGQVMAGPTAGVVDASELPETAIRHLGFRSVARVPLIARAKTVGVLAMGFPVPAAEVRGRVGLLSAIGAHVAAAVESHGLLSDLRRRVEELSLLNEMGRTIAASLDLELVLREGADAARRLVDASRAVVLLYEPLHSELRLSGGVGFGPGELERIAPALGAGTLAPRVIRERRPIVVDEALRDAGVQDEVRRTLGPCALVAAPLLLRGEPLGVLLVDDHRPDRRFRPSDVERVTAVANQLALAIENARLYAAARERLREITTVIDVARVVSSSLDLEEVLGAGAEHLKRTLDGSACTILLLGRGDELRRAATRGPPIGPDGVPADAPSLPRDALAAHAPVAGRPGTPDAAVLAVPLHVREMPVGVALVTGATPDRVFTPGELARATAIASQLAVAVDNARLYSETRRRAEELGLLHEVGRSLVETLDIQQLLERGVQNLARIVDAPAASLLLVTPDQRSLEVRAVSGAHGGHLGVLLPLGTETSLASLVVRRREPVVIEDALVDPRVNPLLRSQTGARGYLGLPLVVRERTIGAVIIMEPRGPRRFTPPEVERAAAIANQLAVAVENARLYEDLRRSYEELERAQHRLVQRERLAALGELSAVVAHEVRNPLGVIFNSLGSLRRLVRPAGDAKLLLDIVGEEADRLNRIVGDLLDFARPSTPELRPERLETVVQDAVGAALAQKAAPVEVVHDHDAEVPPVPMDARLVRQAILNVAVNAVQAMPRGGRITLRTRRAGESVVLEIEDTGAGIPAEVSARIFEPFFTTKASGTGLGLAVVKRIVEGHGGTVVVRNQPGAGAVFALSFPLAGSVEKEPMMG